MVFSTLNTNDPPGAIPRLQDMGAEPYLIASVLEGVLAQRLVRRICQACRAPETPSAADIEALGVEAPPGVTLYRGLGCDECRNTGYRGRTAIYELFTITEDVRSLILRRASSREIDRKSTRLNSSHLGISYAVFCLKKKKHKYILQILRKPSDVYTDTRMRAVRRTVNT